MIQIQGDNGTFLKFTFFSKVKVLGMQYIKNRDQLLSHGNARLRSTALDILDHGVYCADPYVKTKQWVSLEDNALKIGDAFFDLDKHQRIFVVGAGKATYPIAKALEEILGERITRGVIICKYGQEGSLDHCELYHASHPVPDQAGVEAASKIMDIARQTGPDDIVIAAITGGSTSLMPYPPEGISIEDKRAAFKLLLRSSANIIEMNAVRKHLTRSKGGWLAKTIHPKAVIINLTVSDVIGDPLDYITCPTVPDTSTFDDARAVMTKYSLWDRVPESIATYLRNGGPDQETPKDLSDHTIISHVIVAGDAACVGALQKAQELGFNSMILSSMLEGESKEIGSMFVAIGKEAILNNRPLQRPCAIIGGGEATMKIQIPDPGEGGPNQQFALAAATWIQDQDHIVVAGIDTDGTDGVSNLAGGIVDRTSVAEASRQNINLYDYMAKFNDSEALRKLGDAIYTGATGTNVNDLKLVIVE
jgi:glycerate-2-kinase